MTVYTANPGDDLQTKASMLEPGDTLLLNNGTYTATASTYCLRIVGVQGTAAAPILVKAVNDGMAILDGGSGAIVNAEPIFISNSSYVTVEGVVARNSYGNVVYVYGGAGSGNGPCDHISLKRITAHGAGAGNVHVFSIATETITNTLVEDCAAWGPGRYMFVGYHCNTITFRRCYAYWNTINNSLLQPRSGFGAYSSTNATYENCIGIHAYPQAANTSDIWSPNYYTGLWHDSDDTVNFPCDNVHHYGSIYYNNWEAFHANESVGVGLVVQDCYFECPAIAGTLTDRVQGTGFWSDDPHDFTINHCTFRNNVVGFHRASGAGVATITNNAFVGNTTGIQSDPGHSYCGFYGNGALGTSTVGTDNTSDPGYDIATYGRGGALSVKSTSTWKGQGTAGSDIGANILYQYVDGSLTPAKLWPWPMEERIVAELGVSPTYESGGGLWKTLSDVYPPAPAFASRSFGAAYPSTGIEFPLLYAPRALGGDYVTSTLHYLPRSLGSAVLYAWDVSEDITTRLRFGSVTPNTQDTSTRLRLAESLEYAPRSFGGDYPTNALFYQPRSFGAAVLSGWGNLLDASTRLKVLAVQKRDLPSRLRLITASIRAVATRLHLGGGSGYRNTVISDNPRAYYRLDTTTGTTVPDESGNSYVATLVGSVTFSQAGALSGDPDSATLFTTGSSSLVLPPTLAPSTWTALSLEFWISISSGYQHVVVTTNATATILYLDGSPYAAAAGDPVLIDTALAYAGSYLAGTLDEVSLYNYVLTSGQVQAHFLAAVPRPAVATRLRALAATRRDAGLRLFFSPPIFSVRSLFARTRLLAVGKQDASSRLVFSFPRALRDGSLRLILLASVGKDTALRLRTLAVGKLNQAARLSFFPTPILILVARCVLGVQRFRDYGTRCVVRAASIDIWPQAARIRLLAVARRDVAARIVFLSTQLVLLSLRTRLRAQAQRDAILRLLLFGVRIQNQASRLRVLSSSLTLSDMKQRLRILATHATDSTTRFVFSLPRMRDYAARLVVRAASVDFWPLAARLKVLAVTRRDQASRVLLLLLHSTNQAGRLRLAARVQQDAMARVLLLSSRLNESTVRLRLLPSFVVTASIASRLRLLSVQAVGISSRFGVSVQHLYDYAARLVLHVSSTDLLDIRACLLLLARTAQDQTYRLRVAAINLQGQATRLLLRAFSPRDAQGHLRLLDTRSWDAALRVRLRSSFTVFANSAMRLRFLTVQVTGISSRFGFSVQHLRDYAARLVLHAAAVDLLDVRARLRLLVGSKQDQFARVHLFPNTHTFTRLLLLAQRGKDTSMRFALSARQVANASVRLRLLASSVVPLGVRLRLAVLSSLDSAARLRLLASFARMLDTAVRLRLLASRLADIGSRLIYGIVRVRDLAARLATRSASVDFLDDRMRLRILAVGDINQSSRLRVFVTSRKEQVARFRLRALLFGDAQSRLVFLGVHLWNTALRVRLLPSFVALADASFRLRLLSVRTKDSAMRLVYGVGRARDYAVRLVLHAASADLLDARQRLRVLAVSKRTLAARLYLFLNTATSTRLRLLDQGVRTLGLRALLATVQGKDVHARIRLLDAPVSLLAGRLRLSSPHLLDTGTRLRLLIPSFLRVEDSITRTRLRAVHALSMGSRLAYGIPRAQDNSSRVLLRAASADVFPQAARLRLLGAALWDSATRLRLVLVRQLPLRLRLLAQSSHDGLTRLRTLSVAKRDQAARLRFLALHVTDTSLRLRLLSRPFSSTSLRLRFGSVTPHAQDAPVRLLLSPLALVTALSTRDGQAQCLSRESPSGLSLRDGSTALVARPPTL